MNQKQLLVLLVLVAVLGGAGLMIYRNSNASWSGAGVGAGRKLLGDLPVNDVAAIVIKSGTNELDLAKKDNLWRVAQRSDYPADYSAIRGFLLKAADLKATQVEEVGPSQLGRFKLLPPGPGTNSGTLVEFRDAGGKAIQSLLLGREHRRKPDRGAPVGEGADEGWPDGRYVMAGMEAKTVAVIADPLGNMDVKAEQWLNKDFFKVEKPRLIRVEFAVETNSWKVTRDSENGDWKLSDAKAGEQLDSAKTSGFASALGSPTFLDVLPRDTKAPTAQDQPNTIAIATFDDFTYTLKISAKTNDNYFLAVNVAAALPKERTPAKDEKPEDKAKLDVEFKDRQKKFEDKLAQEKGFEPWTYLVSGWTVDALLKKRSELLVEKKEVAITPEPKTDEPAAEPKKD